jgi:hypothetical protein
VALLLDLLSDALELASWFVRSWRRFLLLITAAAVIAMIAIKAG